MGRIRGGRRRRRRRNRRKTRGRRRSLLTQAALSFAKWRLEQGNKLKCHQTERIHFGTDPVHWRPPLRKPSFDELFLSLNWHIQYSLTPRAFPPLLFNFQFLCLVNSLIFTDSALLARSVQQLRYLSLVVLYVCILTRPNTIYFEAYHRPEIT